MGGAAESVTTTRSNLASWYLYTVSSAEIVFTSVFFISTFLNQATAAFMASIIFGSGFFSLIRNRTISELSELAFEANSNVLAPTGCRVLLSCCWHQTVGTPCSTIWHFR